MNGAPRGWLVSAVALVLLICGCTGQPKKVDPPEGAQAVAEQLAMALQAGKIDKLPLDDSTRATTDYQQTTGALGGLLPEVSVAAIDYADTGMQASVRLDQRYDFDQGQWSFSSAADLRHHDGGWQIVWLPTIVHPGLSDRTRLYDERTTPRRASILGAGGVAIVEDRPVYRVGLDKTLVAPDQADASARALAQMVGIDADSYAQQVAASGPQAFVLAITLREGQVPVTIDSVPGARALGTTLPLAPTANFARGILGSAGDATAEAIERSDGAIKAGDVVGLSGLQLQHDEQLRGTPGHAISIIVRSEAQLTALPPATPTPEPDSASATPSPSVTGSATPASPSASPSAGPQLLFSVAPVSGNPLQLTMNLDLQRRAEEILAPHGDALVMLVVLDKATGGVLAAANSPAAGAQSFATTGRYPPGSTMKIATTLALLRRGYTPDTPVNCSATAEINGRVFSNYPGYPSAFLGMIPLRTAVAQSCNTAFMNASRELSAAELTAAAASLGFGQDFESGFDAFYGSVPVTDDPVVHAADTIGQGEVLVSVMALAAEAASVAASQTVVPYLVESQKPTPTAQPLTAEEAAALQIAMTGVITQGTGQAMAGVLQGAKTGTAEFGNENPPRTHSWIVGWTDQYAICAMSYDGGHADQQVVTQFMTG